MPPKKAKIGPKKKGKKHYTKTELIKPELILNGEISVQEAINAGIATRNKDGTPKSFWKTPIGDASLLYTLLEYKIIDYRRPVDHKRADDLLEKYYPINFINERFKTHEQRAKYIQKQADRDEDNLIPRLLLAMFGGNADTLAQQIYKYYSLSDEIEESEFKLPEDFIEEKKEVIIPVDIPPENNIDSNVPQIDKINEADIKEPETLADLMNDIEEVENVDSETNILDYAVNNYLVLENNIYLPAPNVKGAVKFIAYLSLLIQNFSLIQKMPDDMIAQIYDIISIAEKDPIAHLLVMEKIFKGQNAFISDWRRKVDFFNNPQKIHTMWEELNSVMNHIVESNMWDESKQSYWMKESIKKFLKYNPTPKVPKKKEKKINIDTIVEEKEEKKENIDDNFPLNKEGGPGGGGYNLNPANTETPGMEEPDWNPLLNQMKRDRYRDSMDIGERAGMELDEKEFADVINADDERYEQEDMEDVKEMGFGDLKRNVDNNLDKNKRKKYDKDLVDKKDRAFIPDDSTVFDPKRVKDKCQRLMKIIRQIVCRPPDEDSRIAAVRDIIGCGSYRNGEMYVNDDGKVAPGSNPDFLKKNSNLQKINHIIALLNARRDQDRYPISGILNRK